MAPLSRRPLSLFLHLLAACALSVGASAGLAQAVRLPGSTQVGASAAVVPVLLTATQAGSVQAIHVTTNGVEGADYRDAGGGTCASGASLSPGQQCTVNVLFSAAAPGDRRGAVVLTGAAGQTLATRGLTAVATGALATFIPGTMSTVAGSQAWVYGGDGGLATQSSIFLPFGVAVDSAGNLFLADSSNNRIRRVDAAQGTISTLAGNGAAGSAGDGGPATQAALSNPSSVALDAAGNVFFADSGNHAIRRIDAFNGQLTTLAGTLGHHGYAGDGGLATQALLNGPTGLALDADGNLYFADTGNHAVRRVDAATGLIVSVAGNGSAGFAGDNGPATAARLNAPWGLALTSSGTLLIADQNNHRIRSIDPSGLITTFAGTGVAGYGGEYGPATAALLNVPAGLAVDVSGNVYIADSGNDRVRRVNAVDGMILPFAGNGSEAIAGVDGPADQSGIYGPYALALDDQGSLYVADVFHNRIRRIAANAATLLFPPMRVGRVSRPLRQRVENDGTEPLNFTQFLAIHDTQVDAATTSCDPTTPLAPHAGCTVGVDFAPTTTGIRVTGLANVVSGSSNSPGGITAAGQVLNVDPTTTTLSSGTNPSLTGNAVAFTVTVTSAGSALTGTVSLFDGTNLLGTQPLGSGSTTVFHIDTLSSGNHTLTASYNGDSNNALSNSDPFFQTVKDLQAATSTTLSAAASTVDAGTPLRLTANVAVVTPGSGSGTLTGTVVFREGSVQLASGTLANGIATASLSSLPVGAHTLTATYSATTNYAASTSAAVTVNVQLATTRVAVSSNANPSPAGAPLTLTATLLSTGITPTGPVSFADNGHALGSAPLNPQGVATLTVPGTAWTTGTHSLSAVYAGDASNGPSSAQSTQTVTLATTATALASSLNPTGLGGQVTLTAIVSGNGGIPGGAVEFYDGTALLAHVALNSTGIATFSTSAFALGNHTLSAAYRGDASDDVSASATLTQIVQPTTIAVAFASSANPVLSGAPLTLTATVSGSGSQPAGTVTLLDGQTIVATAALDSAGHAVFTPGSLSIGSHALTASYSGDTYHAAASSTALDQHVLQVTALTMTSDAPRAIAGLPLAFRLRVTGQSGLPVTGVIEITEGSAAVATLAPDAAGAASFTLATLTPGAHTLQAIYQGDPLNASSLAQPLLETVTMATTATALTSSANPVYAGRPLTLLALVTGDGGTPTGTVTFADGNTVLGTATLAAGRASLTLSTLAPGLHSLSASYAGDPLDNPSTSATLSEQVAQQTTLTVAASASPSLLADPLTLTLTAANGAALAPAGSVILSDNGATLATLTLGAQGVATYTLAAPALGTHSFAATYPGDARNLPATSAALPVEVVLRPSAVSFTGSPLALAAGQRTTFVSVVQAHGPQPATGKVTWLAGSTALATSAVDSAGVATATFTPPQGSVSVIAQYSGDALYAPATSPALILVVGPPLDFLITPTPASVTLASGQHTTVTLQVDSASTFKDTVAFGCAGLPQYATCTFSQPQLALAGGTAKTLTVVVDTGSPLGAGATARLTPTGGSGLAFCALPGALLSAALLLVTLARRRRTALPRLLTLLAVLSLLGSLSGCAASFTQHATPAGSYSFQVVGSGQATSAQHSASVQMTVNQ